jgi:hypothetical protein
MSQLGQSRQGRAKSKSRRVRNARKRRLTVKMSPVANGMDRPCSRPEPLRG